MRGTAAIIGGIVITFLLACGLFAAERTNRSANNDWVEYEFFTMNTPARISLAGSSNDAEAAAREVLLLESLASAFLKSSDISHVNDGAGSFVKVESMTYQIVDEAVRWAHETNGAFDPTVGPIVKLWRNAGKTSTEPTGDEVSAANQQVDYRRVNLSQENEIALMDAEMTLDLGGIAKGYAADLAATELRSLGVKHALIDLGGNLVAISTRPDGSAWNVGVQRPNAPRGELLGTLGIVDESAVTSGPYERFIEIAGKKYHHIVDPRTGYPVDTNLMSVTVISKKSVDADALATAFSVMGVEETREFLASRRDYEAVLVVRDNDDFRIFISLGLEGKFHPAGNDFPIEVLR